MHCMIAASREMSDEPKSRYKNKLTTESYFHLHKILAVSLYFIGTFTEYPYLSHILVG